MAKLYRKKGFTLIELIMILTIIGILAAVAVARMPNMAPIRIDMVARKLQSDIRYAQSLAVSTQRWTGLLFSAANNNYSVYIDGIDDGASIPSGWSIVNDPLTKKNYTVQLNSGDFAGVEIAIVYFNGNDNYLVFDRWGNPYSYTGSGAPVALGNPAGVRISSSSGTKDIVVERGTGRVYLQ